MGANSTAIERKTAGIIAFLTIALGITPLVFLAARSNTLWFPSTVNVPLAAVPSVWLGDSLLLPFFNYYAVLFLLRRFSLKGRASSKPKFRTMVLMAVAAAASVSGYSHYMWTQDRYLGFIDNKPGKLSQAGWWHLGFTTIEMSLVFVFILVWIDVLRELRHDQGSSGFARLAWKGFLCYALLSIADFSVFHWYVLPLRPMKDYTALTSWQGLLVIGFWLAVDTYLRSVGRTEAARGRHAHSSG